MAALELSAERMDEILRQAGSLQLRAPLFAELLRSLWRPSPLSACLLEGPDNSHLSVLDESGQLRGEWVPPLLQCIKASREQAEGQSTNFVKPPAELNLSGSCLAIRDMAFRGHRWGALALAVSTNDLAETRQQVGALLAICGEQLAARLDAEAQALHLQALQRDLEGQSWLASTGEMAGPLGHELNNFLNVVLLHVAIMEPEIPQKLRSELTELRRQAASMTLVMKQFQQVRRRRQSVQELVEMSQIVGDTVKTLAGPTADSREDPHLGPLTIQLPPSSRIDMTGLARPAAVPLHVALPPGLPPVVASAADMKRLCTFLLTNAAVAAGAAASSVTIRTWSTEKSVLLCVEDGGPSVAPELLPQLLEPSTLGRAGTNSLELAACEAIVRRWQGKIRCANRAEGGLAITVEFPQAQMSESEASAQKRGMLR